MTGKPSMVPPSAAPAVPQKKSFWKRLPSGESVGL
jgi:hypothetical protein